MNMHAKQITTLIEGTLYCSVSQVKYESYLITLKCDRSRGAGFTGFSTSFSSTFLNWKEVRDYYVLPDDWCASYAHRQGAEPVSEEVLLSEAETGNVTAQWELYKRRKSRGEYDFKWLCKAAEQGDYRSRWELGYLYHYGLYGVRKDLVLSVMRYSLVESVGHDPKGVDNIREQLTPEQLTEAEHLYDNWIPGRCERDLVPDNPRN